MYSKNALDRARERMCSGVFERDSSWDLSGVRVVSNTFKGNIFFDTVFDISRNRLESWFESRRGRSRAPSGAYWGPIDKYLLHCIRTFRVGFEHNQIPCPSKINEWFLDIEFDTTRIRLEPSSNPSSNPARNVRMQWSNTYLLVSTMLLTELVNAPVWICNSLLTELVNAPDWARERSRWRLNAPDGAREPRERWTSWTS